MSHHLMQFETILNNSRYRSIIAGGVGGLLGWLVAETVVPIVGGPKTFSGVGLIGAIVGAGIGIALGIAEGLVIRNWHQVRRGAIVGAIIGALGGVIGAVTAQSVSTSAGGGSAFSTEMQDRLAAAGAKKGAIEVALSWENTNDLDLHVIDPDGARVWFRNKISPSGGELDVDRNVGCVRPTNQPVEHIVWTRQSPPRGTYQVCVHHYANCEDPGPTEFRLEIRVDEAEPIVIDGVSDPGLIIQRVDDIAQIPVAATFEFPSSGHSNDNWLLRLVGWIMFGGLVGLSQGLVRRSRQAVLHAMLGGILGGAAGGALFEAIAGSGVGDVASRLVGFVVLGVCIGLCIVLVEQALSAVLWVTSGRNEGRQILLDRPVMRMGRQELLEVFVGGDPQIAAHHATIRRDGNEHLLIAEGGGVSVNGAPVSRSPLKDGDRIQIGATRFRYGRREDTRAVDDVTVDDGARDRTAVSARRVPLPPPPPPPGVRRTPPSPDAKSSTTSSTRPRPDPRSALPVPPPPPPPTPPPTLPSVRPSPTP